MDAKKRRDLLQRRKQVGTRQDGYGFVHDRKHQAVQSYKRLLHKQKDHDGVKEIYEREKKSKIDSLTKRSHHHQHILMLQEKARMAKLDKAVARRKREEEMVEKNQERLKAIAAAKEARRNRCKLLHSRTRNGQPCLGDRVKLLVQQIEKYDAKSSSNKN